MVDPRYIPVIAAIGEHIDRPVHVQDALEPVDLIALALRAAEVDSGTDLLLRINRIDLVGLVSWRYENPVALVCERLGIDPAVKINSSMGGETPVRLVHDAAIRIARGERSISAIVGGEASYARNRARKEKVALNWTPLPPLEATVRFPGSNIRKSDQAIQLGVVDPAQIYPFYEMATQAAWKVTPLEANRYSAELWERYAEVAADNPSAWIRTSPDATTIGTIAPDNRLINWPYPKFMVANPAVNLAAAIIVMSLAEAQAAGISDDRLIYILGGAAANEPENYLERDRYDRSTAQEAVLARAVDLVGGRASAFDRLELYSCFPVIPKMALRALNLDAENTVPTVTGGLTFFGGPLNNYMSHAAAAMVRVLRSHPGETGLLYGQGGYVSKHHALILGTKPPVQALDLDYSVQGFADSNCSAAPRVIEKHEGLACIETYTIIYARDGVPIEGIVILRTENDERTMARVLADDTVSFELLIATDRTAVGSQGVVQTDVFGKSVWRALAALQVNPLRHCRVDRDGPLTIVTINRPDSMNALTPDANAELARVFDDFVSDPDQWVAILTGAGRAFSAGNDLKWLARAMARGVRVEVPMTGFAGLTSRFDNDKPIIAAVNGLAMGGGFEIALACDLIIAAESAEFALPEPKVGLAAMMGGLLRLPRQIGLKRAMGLILTGRRVSATEGAMLGFVNEVVPDGDLMSVAKRWAGSIIACSPMSIRASKQVVMRALDLSAMGDAVVQQDQYPAIRALYRSADAREGPLAFAQKRLPIWTVTDG